MTRFTAKELRNIADALDVMTKMRKEQGLEFGTYTTTAIGTSDNYLEASWFHDPESDSTYYDQYVAEVPR